MPISSLKHLIDKSQNIHSGGYDLLHSFLLLFFSISFMIYLMLLEVRISFPNQSFFNNPIHDCFHLNQWETWPATSVW